MSSSSASPSPEAKRSSQPSLEDALREHEVRCDDDNRISWEDGAKAHPRNWGHIKKAYAVAVICWLETYMTAISSSGVCLPGPLIPAWLTFTGINRRQCARRISHQQNPSILCFCVNVSQPHGINETPRLTPTDISLVRPLAASSVRPSQKSSADVPYT